MSFKEKLKKFFTTPHNVSEPLDIQPDHLHEHHSLVAILKGAAHDVWHHSVGRLLDLLESKLQGTMFHDIALCIKAHLAGIGDKLIDMAGDKILEIEDANVTGDNAVVVSDEL